MANPPDQEVLSTFMKGIEEFKAKSDKVVTEITSNFGGNLNSAMKNYTEFQTTYLNGYNSITGGAQKAVGQLLESMEKHFADFKKQLAGLYSETVNKSNDAIGSGMKSFQAQCEDLKKKYPIIPENILKEVINSTTNSKDKLASELGKRYQDFLSKVEKNFQDLKKALAVPEFKLPTLPVLDMDKSIIDISKDALQSLLTNNLASLMQVVKK